MINILLTGSDGQLGQEFQILFRSLGVKYIATDYKQLDITNYNSLLNFFKDNDSFTHIINCAAYNDVDQAEIEKNRAKKLNTEAVKMLADFAKKINAVYTSYSTDFVFNGIKKSPYTEEDIPNPLSEYGKSKLKGEEEVFNTYYKSFIIRTSWLFSVKCNNFNRQIIKWSQSSSKLRIIEDQVSAPTYAKDLAYFSWKLINTQEFGLYHFSNSGVASRYEQAEYLLTKIAWKGTLEKALTKEFNLLATRPEYSKLSSEKIEKLLGEKIPHWQDAMDRFLLELSEQGEENGKIFLRNK